LNLPANKRPKQKPITKVEASGDIILASYPNLSKSQFIPSPIGPQPYSKEEDGKRIGEYQLPLKNKDDKQQQLFTNRKILIPIITIVIGAVVAVVVFGSGILHPSQPMLVPPLAIDKSVTTSASKPVNITLQGHSDQGNVNLMAKIITNPSHGTLGPIDQATGMVPYTPNPGYTGVDSFTFKVNDGKVDSSNIGTVKIAVR
jgi:hypothetical protein